MDAASKVLKALEDCPKTTAELKIDTGLGDGGVQNGLRNLVREGRILGQPDQGEMLWSIKSH